MPELGKRAPASSGSVTASGELLGHAPRLSMGAKVQACLPDSCARVTFESCKLDPRERLCHAQAYALTRDLLALRQREPAFSAQHRARVDGAVLGPEAFVLRVNTAEPAEETTQPQPDQEVDEERKEEVENAGA